MATIATEHNMQPYKLAVFLDLGRKTDYEK